MTLLNVSSPRNSISVYWNIDSQRRGEKSVRRLIRKIKIFLIKTSNTFANSPSTSEQKGVVLLGSRTESERVNFYVIFP
jgi:hypothetical protein